MLTVHAHPAVTAHDASSTKQIFTIGLDFVCSACSAHLSLTRVFEVMRAVLTDVLPHPHHAEGDERNIAHHEARADRLDRGFPVVPNTV